MKEKELCPLSCNYWIGF